MISSQTLLGMSQVDITTINPSTLVDVSAVSISPNCPMRKVAFGDGTNRQSLLLYERGYASSYTLPE